MKQATYMHTQSLLILCVLLYQSAYSAASTASAASVASVVSAASTTASPASSTASPASSTAPIASTISMSSATSHISRSSTIILIRSPETSTEAFSAYKETEPVKTYAQYQLDKKNKTPRPVSLHSLLKQAQMEFLSHEPNQSKNTFQIITENIHSFDWNTEERKIIFYSLFRLAQMEKDPQKKKLLLHEALIFGIDIELDFQLFPPPLMELYLQIKKTATFVSLDLKNLFPLHEIIIINGKIYKNTKKATLPYGTYRVTALSSSHKSKTQILSLSHLMAKQLKTSPLISGSCRQPTLSHLSKILNENQIRILFPNFCIWNSLQHQLVKKQQNNLSTNVMIEELEESTQTEQWWEKEWIWLGAVLIVGTTTIVILSQSETDHKTTKKNIEKSATIKIGF